MTDAITQAEAALEYTVSMAVPREAQPQVMAAARNLALVVHDATVIACCNDIDKAGEIVLYGEPSEAAALRERLLPPGEVKT